MTRDNWNDDIRESERNIKRTKPSLLEENDRPARRVKTTSFANSNVVISSPSSFDDVQTLIDNLRRREPVIFNLESISKESAQRILDFMSGAAYALGGSMKRIKEFLFLVTPEGVSITVPVE